MAEPQIRYCTTTDGVSIAYYAMGEGSPLVFVSNILWSNVRYASLLIPEFHRSGEGIGRGTTVVRYDARGSGLSDRTSLDYSVDARLADLDAVLAKLALGRFSLYGGNHATAATIEYAARHPDEVEKVVLYNPYAVGPDYQQRVRRLDSFRELADEEWDEYTLTVAAANVGYSDSALIESLARRFRESMEPSAVKSFHASLESIDVRAALPRIQAPTLVLFREGVTATGAVTADMAREVASGIPDCEFVQSAGERGSWWTEVETASVERFLGIEPQSGERTPAEQPSPALPPRQTSGALQTILFTDIEANTELLQRVGDSEWRHILRDHERITRGLLAEHGGTEIKTIGDAFMTAFNSASAALECAIALQQAFAAHNDQAGMAVPHALRVRIGINAGEPIAEDDPEGRADLFGTAVTTASRIQSLAKGGEILVSDVVRQLVAGKGFMFDDRGETVLRGFDDPVRIFAVRVG